MKLHLLLADFVYITSPRGRKSTDKLYLSESINNVFFFTLLKWRYPSQKHTRGKAKGVNFKCTQIFKVFLTGEIKIM